MSTPDSTPDSAPDGVAGRRGEFEEDILDVPHAADDPLEALPRRAVKGSQRIVGIDFARSVALLGMMVVHTISPKNGDGDMPWSWQLSAGNAAALFATLAGVGIAFSTGRSQPPRGRRFLGAMVALVVRALLIGAIGLALGSVVLNGDANIILPYYAVLFLLAIPFLRFPAPLLAVLSLLVAVGVPGWSHFARQNLPVVAPANFTFASVMADPGQALTQVLLTGAYPALPWMAYLLAGLAIGRLSLRRWAQLWLIATGTALAVAAQAGSWFVMQRLGGLDQLATVSQQTMTYEQFKEFLIWGATGTLPTDSLWWLGVLAPHTTTPFDLLYTLGIATAVLGACMMMGVVVPGLVTPLAIMGSMPLTMYSLHLLMLEVPFFPEGLALYLLQAVILFGFAFLWSRRFERGPLEGAVNFFAGGVRSLIAGKR